MYTENDNLFRNTAWWSDLVLANHFNRNQHFEQYQYLFGHRIRNILRESLRRRQWLLEFRLCIHYGHRYCATVYTVGHDRRNHQFLWSQDNKHGNNATRRGSVALADRPGRDLSCTDLYNVHDVCVRNNLYSYPGFQWMLEPFRSVLWSNNSDTCACDPCQPDRNNECLRKPDVIKKRHTSSRGVVVLARHEFSRYRLYLGYSNSSHLCGQQFGYILYTGEGQHDRVLERNVRLSCRNRQCNTRYADRYGFDFD